MAVTEGTPPGDPKSGEKITRIPAARGAITNPPIHTAWNRSNPWGTLLDRGYMVRAPSAATDEAFYGDVRPQVRLGFMFNPGEVRHAISIDPNIVPPSQMTDAQAAMNAGQYAMPSTFNFDIMFDRTHEAASRYKRVRNWDGDGVGAMMEDPRGPGGTVDDDSQVIRDSLEGVMVDVRVVHQLLGADQFGDFASMVPVWVFFGYSRHALSFYGQITSYNINYLQFNRLMVPLRATVSFNFKIFSRKAWNKHNELDFQVGGGGDDDTPVDGSPIDSDLDDDDDDNGSDGGSSGPPMEPK